MLFSYLMLEMFTFPFDVSVSSRRYAERFHLVISKCLTVITLLLSQLIANADNA